MNNPVLLIPLVLWLFTYGIISLFHRRVKKKLGVNSEDYGYYKLPNFIAILLNSLVSVGLILFVMTRSEVVPPEATTYFVAPYFGILAYHVASSFRALKEGKLI